MLVVRQRQTFGILWYHGSLKIHLRQSILLIIFFMTKLVITVNAVHITIITLLSLHFVGTLPWKPATLTPPTYKHIHAVSALYIKLLRKQNILKVPTQI